MTHLPPSPRTAPRRRPAAGSPSSLATSNKQLATLPGGFTLIEMLTTVAVLVILMGLAVSLARDVRRRSANTVTGQLLAKLDLLVGQYLQTYGSLPRLQPLLPATQDPTPGEARLRDNATLNNQQFIRALRGSPALSKELTDFPASIYNEASLLDAWGSPVVLMPAMHPAIGMAPANRFFLFSAGPDRRYLTRDDNIYSYDQSQTLPPPTTAPAPATPRP